MTVLQICHAALLKNGQYETLAGDFLTNPATKSAELCATFWDNSRRSVLRMQPWTCAKTRTILTGDLWKASSQAIKGDVVTVVRSGTPEQYICVTEGTTGSTAPTWATTGTIADGTAAWQFMRAVMRMIPEANNTAFEYMYAVPANYMRSVDVMDNAGRPVAAVFENGILYSDTERPILSYIYDNDDPGEWDPLLVQSVMLQLASELAYPLTGSHENAIAFAQASQAMIREGFRQTRREYRQGPAPTDEWTQGLFPERKR
jgi:hypothetical protein